MPMKYLKICLISTLIVTLTQCSPLGTQYRVIQQGNIISEDDVNQLSLGMDKDQVLDILGTPLINNTFDPDHWDYVYSREVSGKIVEQDRVIIEFQDNRATNIQQDLQGA